MATKGQVLALLGEGLTPKQVAEILDCNPAYVRATRMRATVPGYARRFASYERNKKRSVERYKTDPKFRAIHAARVRESRRRAKARANARAQEARA